jgi:solute carrier family 35 (UDP-sugar transporter), member A1/2/3
MSFAHVDWKGWAALATFSVQNGAAVLIMRYSKINGAAYSSQVAVLMQEIAIKLPVCMLLYALECGGVLKAMSSIVNDLRERPTEWAQLAVPALLYTVQNTMLYVGYANVEAAIGQITYQSKIVWTAVFSVLILGKKLSVNQWLALCVLAFGVILVQIVPQPAVAPPPPSSSSLPSPAAADAAADNDKHAHGHKGKIKAKDEHASVGRGLADEVIEQNPLLGVGALVLAALCTAFASVYFEKMLKGASKPSLWLRNIQLAIYCSVIAAIGVLVSGDPKIEREGWLYGFNTSTWLSVTWQAMGGILVAVTIKYADNILRGFAQGLALIFGAIGSSFLFGFQITCVPSTALRHPPPFPPVAPRRCGQPPPTSSPASTPPPRRPFKVPWQRPCCLPGVCDGPKTARGNELAAASACCCEYDIPGTLPPGPLPHHPPPPCCEYDIPGTLPPRASPPPPPIPLLRV